MENSLSTEDQKESFESMKREALVRMIILGLDAGIIKDLEYNDKLYCSDNGKITEVPKHIFKEIEEWQDKFGNLVYHVIHSHFIYETYECLSVSCYKEDWEYERTLIEDNWVMSHSINIIAPSFTESGSIKVQKVNGTLTRIN